MNTIFYATKNPNKIASAKKKMNGLDVEIKPIDLDIKEIQASNSKEVAIDKAEQAFRFINEPVLANDVSWHISALKGFPGPYMNDVDRWLSNSDFLKLLEDEKNREIKLTSVLVYKDSKMQKVITNTRVGTILQKPKGEGRLEFDRIVSFRKDKLSIAQCTDEDIDISDDGGSVWKKFVEWRKDLAN